MRKTILLTVMLLSVSVLIFSQSALTGTYRYSTNAYITFTGNSFTGSWNATNTMSGTFTVSGSRLTLNITGGTKKGNTWVWTIVDVNTLRDQDGDSWKKESSSVSVSRSASDYENSAREANSRGDYDQAIADFTSAIRLGATASRYNSRGWSYIQKKDYDRAIADTTEAIRLAPDYGDAYNNRGLAYEKKGNISSALSDFITSLRLDYSNNTSARENLERVLASAPSGSHVLWNVNNMASWIEAVNGIRNGGNNKVHSITVTGTVSVPMSESITFGSASNIVVILEGGTLTPSSNGYLLQIGAGQIIIAKNITLKGLVSNNASVVNIVNGGAFRMEGNASVTGNNRGGVYVSKGNFTMLGNASITGNINTSYGGGVYIESGNFNMNDNTSILGNIVNDGSLRDGGGVYVKSGTFTMNGSSSISGNKCDGGGDGGGVFIASGTFIMNGSSSVSGNKCDGGGNGGGVYVTNGTFIMGENTSVKDNTADKFRSSGGGVCIVGGEFTMEKNAIVSGNRSIDGGGVYVHVYVGGSSTMRNDANSVFTIRDNAAVSSNSTGNGGYGGGLLVNWGIINIEGGTISNNISDVGGGICFYPSYYPSSYRGNFLNSIIIKGGTISNNTARKGGGGIYFDVEYGGSFTMVDGSITGNTASNGNGGGVGIVNGNFTMTGGSITGNTALNGSGGGVSGNFTMQGGTLSGNTSTGQGGGVYVSGNFTKTGGVIYGNDASQELRNTVTIRHNGNGHAVYSDSRWRDSTAGTAMNTDTYGFWLND